METDSSPALESRTCENCQREFQPSRPWQVFCKPICRNSYWNRLHGITRQALREGKISAV